MDNQFFAVLYDGGDRGAHVHLDPERLAASDQLSDEVAVEPSQRALAPMEDRHGRAGTRCDVGELESDVAAADEGHTGAQLIELQEGAAGGQMLLAGDPQGCVSSPGSDHHPVADAGLVTYPKAGAINEARARSR